MDADQKEKGKIEIGPTYMGSSQGEERRPPGVSTKGLGRDRRGRSRRSLQNAGICPTPPTRTTRRCNSRSTTLSTTPPTSSPVSFPTPCLSPLPLQNSSFPSPPLPALPLPPLLGLHRSLTFRSQENGRLENSTEREREKRQKREREKLLERLIGSPPQWASSRKKPRSGPIETKKKTKKALPWRRHPSLG